MKTGLSVGCCGFPVARDRCFLELDAVEISTTAHRIPKIETARRWRSEAPSNFTFSVRAPKALCQEAAPFRVVGAMRSQWSAFEAVLRVLRPAFVVYETPALFYPRAEDLRAMYDFFKGIGRGPWRSVWISRGIGFDERLQTKIASDLKLLLGWDLLIAPRERPSGAGYFHLSGRMSARRLDRGVSFTDTELKTALSRAAAGGPAYLFFNNAAMWRDARRLKAMASGGDLVRLGR